MPYQSIVDAIRRVSQSVNPNGSFIHGRREDGSILYDAPFPQIHLYPFLTTTNTVNDTDSHALIMAFWFQDSPDSTNEQREEIIAKAGRLCNDFIQGLEEEDIQVTTYITEPQYQTLHGTLSGYALRFTAIEPFTC